LNDQFGQGFDFNINLSDILFDKQIGSGASATVYKGTYKGERNSAKSERVPEGSDDALQGQTPELGTVRWGMC
jgi:hypothetical protein